MLPPDDIIATGGKTRRRSFACAPAPSLHPVHARCRCEAGPCPGGGNILALRGRQETRPGHVKLHMAGLERAEVIRLSGEHVEKGHGRTGIRQSAICHEAGMLQDLHHWPGLQCPADARTVIPAGRQLPNAGRPSWR